MAGNNVLHVPFGFSVRPVSVAPNNLLAERLAFSNLALHIRKFCDSPLNQSGDSMFQIEGTWADDKGNLDFMCVRYDRFSADPAQEEIMAENSYITPWYSVKSLAENGFLITSCIGRPGEDGRYKEEITEQTHDLASFTRDAYAHFEKWTQMAPRHLKAVPQEPKSEFVGPSATGRAWWTPQRNPSF
jgi:hypothetical protein